MRLAKDIYEFKWWILSIIYALLFISMTLAVNHLIFTDAYYYSILGRQLDEERIAQIIEINKKYQWIGYIIMPVILLLKWLILAGVIYIGLFLFNQDIAYQNCFKIVLIADYAMILAAIAKFAWFIFFKPQTIEDIQYFYPLSITQLFNSSQIPKFLVYPLQQFNVFEVLYWLLIAEGIQTFSKKNFWYSVKIVSVSYGAAMFFWCVVIVFLQLQFS